METLNKQQLNDLTRRELLATKRTLTTTIGLKKDEGVVCVYTKALWGPEIVGGRLEQSRHYAGRNDNARRAFAKFDFVNYMETRQAREKRRADRQVAILNARSVYQRPEDNKSISAKVNVYKSFMERHEFNRDMIRIFHNDIAKQQHVIAEAQRRIAMYEKSIADYHAESKKNREQALLVAKGER